MIVKPKSLSQEAFNEYGDVLSISTDQPMADDSVITYWGKIAQFKFVENASAGILHGHRREMHTHQMERHINTPEMLVSLKNDAIICVAKPLDSIQNANAFYIKQGDAVVLNSGTWHWTPFPADADKCEFFIVFKAGTEEMDLEIKELDDAIIIDV